MPELHFIPNNTTDIITIHAREHNIKENQVRVFIGYRCQGAESIARGNDTHLFALQRQLHNLADRRAIIYHQNHWFVHQFDLLRSRAWSMRGSVSIWRMRGSDIRRLVSRARSIWPE